MSLILEPKFSISEQVQRKDYPDIYGIVYEITITAKNVLLYNVSYFHEGQALSTRCYDFELELMK